MIIINSQEYQCWHEVGHSIACMESGGYVESIELANSQGLPYLALAKCSSPGWKEQLHTASGGLAVEIMLFNTRRIKITEEEFWHEAIYNSSYDRHKVCKEEDISEEECLQLFIDYGKQLANDFLPKIDKMERVVKALIDQQKLSGDEVAKIYNEL